MGGSSWPEPGHTASAKFACLFGAPGSAPCGAWLSPGGMHQQEQVFPCAWDCTSIVSLLTTSFPDHLECVTEEEADRQTLLRLLGWTNAPTITWLVCTQHSYIQSRVGLTPNHQDVLPTPGAWPQGKQRSSLPAPLPTAGPGFLTPHCQTLSSVSSTHLSNRPGLLLVLQPGRHAVLPGTPAE